MAFKIIKMNIEGSHLKTYYSDADAMLRQIFMWTSSAKQELVYFAIIQQKIESTLQGFPYWSDKGETYTWIE